jgi:isoleucyl-tRNA synthetase
VQGTPYLLQPQEVILQRHARGEFVVESDGEVVAALDPALTDDLRQEGLAREVVSRIQRMRKDAGYQVADRIRLWVDGDPPVLAATRRHADYISGETLATRLTEGPAETSADLVQAVELDGVRATLAVQRA